MWCFIWSIALRSACSSDHRCNVELHLCYHYSKTIPPWCVEVIPYCWHGVLWAGIPSTYGNTTLELFVKMERTIKTCADASSPHRKTALMWPLVSENAISVQDIASPLNFLARHARNNAQYDSKNEYVLRTYFQWSSILHSSILFCCQRLPEVWLLCCICTSTAPSKISC